MAPKTLSEMYPDPWLKADDLNGRSCVLTIRSITIEEFPENPNNPKSQKVPRAVLDFGRSKRLICNKTQAFTIGDIAQSEAFKDWKGTRITLQPGTAHNGKPTIIITPAPAPTAKAMPAAKTAVPNPMLPKPQPPAPDLSFFDGE